MRIAMSFIYPVGAVIDNHPGISFLKISNIYFGWTDLNPEQMFKYTVLELLFMQKPIYAM